MLTYYLRNFWQDCKIDSIQKNLAFSVDMGFIKSHDDLMTTMRKMWAIKYEQ